MVAAEKLGVLITAANAAVRVMQTAADVLREDADTARAAMLESAAMSLSRAVHNVGGLVEANTVPEHLAALLAVAGKSVRAMQSVHDPVRHQPVADDLQVASHALAAALHEASEQTVPIAIDDVLGDD